DPRGRHLSVNGDRVAIVHGPAHEGDFPKAVRSILDKVHNLQSEVDIALLWESLGNSAREFQPQELAEIFFSQATPQTASAIFHALSNDNLFFKRNGLRFLPKTNDQVTTEQTRRTRQRQREEIRDHLTESVKRLVHDRAAITPEMEPIIDRLQSWMRRGTGDELEAILGRLVGPDQARNTAYDILLRAGRI